MQAISPGKSSRRAFACVAVTLLGCSDVVAPPPPRPPLHPLPAEPIARPQIAFASNRDGREYVYVANADGSAVGRLALGWAPAWSWDGEKIAYEGRVSGGIGSTGIFVMNADGSDQRRLTEDGGSPAWAPDGRILFTRGGADGGIYVMNGDGSGVTEIIDAEFPVTPDDSQEGPVSLWDTTWSPDGRSIAFMRWRSGAPSPSMFLANADGTDPRRFAEGRLLASPAFSPDGSRVAFEYFFQGASGCVATGSAIAVATLDAAAPAEFEPRCGPGLAVPRYPDWSHFGTELVFSQPSRVGESWSSYPTRQRIYTVFLADGRWRQLVPEAVSPAQADYDDFMPVWARVAR